MSVGERIWQIGQHLAKQQKYSGTFFLDSVYCFLLHVRLIEMLNKAT